MTARSAILLLVWAGFVGGADRQAFAQAPGPSPVSGIWEVTVGQKDGPPRVHSYLSFNCGIGSARGRFVLVENSYSDYIMYLTFENGLLKWNGYEMRFSADGSVGTGTWSNGSETYRSTWKRVPPQGAAVRVVSHTKDKVRLEISGSKIFYFDPGPNARCNAIYPESQGLLLAAKTPGPGEQSITVDLTVAPNTPAGRKIIYFDGARLPWHWVGNVGPPVAEAKPRIVELQFGRLEQGQFRPYATTEPMAYDRPFVVQIRYDTEPDFAETGVTLSWGGGEKRRVPVFKSRANPAVFVSRGMIFQDPAACRGLAFCTAIQGVFGDR